MGATSAIHRPAWRWIRRAVAAAGVLTATAGVIWVLREPLLTPLLLRTIERRFGVDVEVESLRGSWLGELRVRSLRASRPPTKFSFEAREIALRYSVLGLVTGQRDWLQRVDADGVSVRIDLGAPQRGQRGPDRRGGFALPEHVPDARLSIARAEFASAGGSQAELSSAELTLAGNGRRGNLGGTLTWRLPSGAAGREEVDLRFGVAAPDLWIAGYSPSNGANLWTSSCDFSDPEGARVEVELQVSAFGGSVRSEGELTAGALRAHFEADDVALEKLAALAPADAPELSGRLDAEGSVELPFSAPRALTGSGSLHLRQGCIAGREIERLQAHFALAPELIAIEDLLALRGTNELSIDSAVVPLAERNALSWLRSARGRILLRGEELEAWIAPQATRSPVPYRLELGATADEEGLVLEFGELVTREGLLVLDEGRLEWGPTLETALSGARVRLSGQADLPDLAPLGALAGRGLWSGSLHGRVHLAGGEGDLEGAIDIEGHELTIANVPVGALEVAVRASSGSLRIERLRAHGWWGEAELALDADLAAREIEKGGLEVRTSALERIAPAVVDSGSAWISAALSGPLFDPLAAFTASASGTTIHDMLVEDVCASGSLQWGRIRLDSLTGSAAGATFELAGELDSKGSRPPFAEEQRRRSYTGRIDELRASSGSSAIALAAPVAFEIGPMRDRCERISLTGSAGRFELAFHREGERADIEVSVAQGADSAVLSAFLPQGAEVVGANASLWARMDGGSVEADAKLAVDRFVHSLLPVPLAARVDARWMDERLFLSELTLDAGSAGTLSARGNLPLRARRDAAEALGDGEIELAVDLAAERLEELLAVVAPFARGDLAAQLRLSGTTQAPQGVLELTSRAIRVTADSSAGELPAAELRGRLVLGESTSLEELRLSLPGKVDLQLAGVLQFPFELRSWLEGRLTPPLDAPLELEARLSAPDLSFLEAFSPALSRGGLRRIGGSVSGACRLSGTLRRPESTGGFELSGGELRLENNIPAISGVHASVSLDGAVLRLDSFAAEFGGGTVRGEGSLDLAAAAPVIDLALSCDQVLLVRSESFRLRTDGELRLSGALPAMSLAGELQLCEGRYTRDIALLAALRGESLPEYEPELFSVELEPFSEIALDVRLVGEEPLRVENSIVRARLRPDLRLRGTLRQPQLLGELFVERSRVALPGGLVEVPAGRITFTRERPLDPDVDLRGETRLSGYRVSIEATGPASAPNVLLSSVPPLPPTDLLVLLLTGRLPPSQQTGSRLEQVTASLGMYLGRDAVSRWLSSGPSSGESIFDRFEMTVGTDATQGGELTRDARLRLSGDTYATGRSVYLRGEEDAYDRTNLGFRIVLRFP